MLAEIGLFAMVLALLAALAQGVLGIAGPWLGRDSWIAAVRPAVTVQFWTTTISLGVLIAAFINNDFSVEYVAANSNSALPVGYRIAAVWGAHEGSLLLWAWILVAWTLAVALLSKSLPESFAARVLGVLGLVSLGFFAFTLLTSNPFMRLDPAAPDGRDLNPLLQDPALAAHPPMLYAGYVGLAVAFAFACAAMIEGRLDQTWARWTRPWTTIAWAFLTIGIALGSWWAYYELGWGGYWFWDPVENASFMPWLVATALIHSLAVTEKRGLFKSWTLLLAILGFSLSLLGTFLVRSGVLVSVHSFAADPARGMFILAFLVIIIGGALTLYAWRAPLLRSEAGFEFTARESFLLFNNILLVVAAGAVFAGTMAPLISDALSLGTLSVGRQYFDPVFLLPTLPLLALAAVGIHSSWKKGRLADRRAAILIALVVAILVTLVLVLGVWEGAKLLTPIGFAVGVWLFLSALVDPIDRRRHDDKRHKQRKARDDLRRRDRLRADRLLEKPKHDQDARETGRHQHDRRSQRHDRQHHENVHDGGESARLSAFVRRSCACSVQRFTRTRENRDRVHVVGQRILQTLSRGARASGAGSRRPHRLLRTGEPGAP